METIEDLALRAPGLTTIWIAALGGCIGSFMNVVVYRLPAGMSLLHPGSHCPACGHAIRVYDNLPVIGWLWLRGRCRDCRSAISPRYPIVEGLMMLIFVNQWHQDVLWTPDTATFAARVFAFVWHISLLSVLGSVSLIDFDGPRVPSPLIGFGASVPLGMTLAAPHLTAQLFASAQPADAWASILGGAGLAALITLLLRPPFRLRRPHADTTPSSPWFPMAMAAMTGLYVGPERAVVALVFTTILWRVIRFLRRPSGQGAPWTWYLTAMCWVSVALR